MSVTHTKKRRIDRGPGGLYPESIQNKRMYLVIYLDDALRP